MHSHAYSSRHRGAVSILALLAAAACANGGTQTTPQSEVKIAASHHLFGFRSLPGFGAFPVPNTAIFTDRGTLNLFDDSTYTIARPSGTSVADRYGIATPGDLSIYVSGTNRTPTLVFRGAYGLGSSDGAYFFTDRVSSIDSQSVGVYYGTRVVNGQVELGGAWHVLSLHSVFDQTVLAPYNVGRAAYGGVSITTDTPGTLRTISGTGTQMTSALTFGGSIQNLLTNNVGDGTCNLTLNYQLAGQQADSRVMLAAATNDIVYALDADETDGEAGMAFLVRKFDAPATPVDPVRVAGTFLVGGQTLFVNPANSGSDAFIGVVTLSAQGGFRLDGVGHQGVDFSYIGTYTLSSDGGMTVSVNGTNETWFAAIDRSYNTLFFVDDFVETRSNNIPELNLGLGVRQQAN